MMTSEVVTRQRLQLLALFLIVATLCHFAARTLLVKTATPGAASSGENSGTADYSAGGRAIGTEHTGTARKLTNRTNSERDPAGMSPAKLAELKQKYHQRLDLWYDDARANPLILDLAGISRERLPELQRVVDLVNEEATRRLKDCFHRAGVPAGAKASPRTDAPGNGRSFRGGGCGGHDGLLASVGEYRSHGRLRAQRLFFP
ncbi:MAG: hypothetical protein JWO82_2871 [Akkermansiaceae bacterium]|nr:hypothetical protein [Akkermansiaceae bacterium]